MSTNSVHVVLVLDRSGSMSSVVPVTIKGVNELITTLKSVQRDTKQNITASFVGFESQGYGRVVRTSGRLDSVQPNPGHELMEGYEDVALKNIKPVTTKEIYGGGGTEMNKAILFTIDELRSKQQPVLVCIFTDGQTSDQNLFEAAAKLVTEQQSKGWTFAYIGANQDAKEVAKQLSIPETNAMEYQSDTLGTRSAFFKLSRGVRKYLENLAKPQIENGLARFDDFFNDEDLKKSVMKVNGMTVTLNMPESVKSEDDDKANELPPYAPIGAHVVDEYPACPANWMHGSSKASSYFVGIKPEHGMWLDFNGNEDSKREVAIVISVQGVNPITGQKTSEMRLEKYETKCPIHDKEFAQERFCKDCGFKWPTQNYLSSTGTPKGQFWLDGFRSPDGKVRQYIFTEEQARGVANAVIGQDRVFAVGIAFFRSKKDKPEPVVNDYSYSRGLGLHASLGGTFSQGRVAKSFNMVAPPSASSPMLGSLGTKSARVRGQAMGGEKEIKTSGKLLRGVTTEKQIQLNDDSFESRSSDAAMNSPLEAMIGSADVDSLSINEIGDAELLGSIVEAVSPKSYEVGAGAKLEQTLHDDPNELSYWEDEPFGFVYINYADEESVAKILKAGKRKEVKEGFMSVVPVGNR